jgi:hypothetical protein
MCRSGSGAVDVGGVHLLEEEVEGIGGVGVGDERPGVLEWFSGCG